MNKGFTLVELSIVLVIIGLLIGGILVGQSLIDSAKLQAFVRQIQQYDIAVAGFHSKYKAIPGDSRLMGWAVVSGGATPPTKDGILTDDDSANNNTQYNSTNAAEHMLFWPELVRLNGLKIENCPNLAATNPAGDLPRISGTDCNQPLAKYGATKAGIFAAAFASVSTPVTTATAVGNAYYMLDCSEQATNAISCKPSFMEAEAMAYDAKIDDGVPGTGQVMAGTRASAIVRLNYVQLTYAPNYYPDSTTNRLEIIKRFENKL